MPTAPKSARTEDMPEKKPVSKKKSSFSDIFKRSDDKKKQKAKTAAPRRSVTETKKKSTAARSYGTSGYSEEKTQTAPQKKLTAKEAQAIRRAQSVKSASKASYTAAGSTQTAPRNASASRSSIDSYLDTYNKTSDWLDEKKRDEEQRKAEQKARKEAKRQRDLEKKAKEKSEKKAEKARARASKKEDEGKRKSAGELLNELRSKKDKKESQEKVNTEGKRKRKTGLKLVQAVVVRSLIYLVIAGIISAFIISVANDAFGLTKVDTTEIEVTIPDGASTKDIAKILHKNKLIKYEFAYVLYAKMTKEDGTAKFGDFILSYDMTYDNIMTTLKRGPFSETNPDDIRILIPEGYECDQIIDLLVSNGLGTRETFEDVINNHDFGYNFIDRIPADRQGYRLEGYLFPDTYIFSKTEGEISIIRRMLLNFDRKITVDLYDRMNELGYSLDETITLASIIEREAGTLSDMPLISSVFHNRLNSDYRYLESDATLQFVIGERKDIVSYEDTELDNPYNTYQYAGLPPGPIASPGLAAIKAALYPEDTNYFYFVARGDGTSMFAETYEEHQRNVTVASRTWGN